MININRRETRVDTSVTCEVVLQSYDLWDFEEVLSMIRTDIPKKVRESYPEETNDSGTTEQNHFSDRLNIQLYIEDLGVGFSLVSGLRDYARHLERMKDTTFARYYSEACVALKERQEAEVVSD